MKAIESTPFMDMLDQFLFAIDNNKNIKTVNIGSKIVPVYAPDILTRMNDVIVLLTSPVYMYDMYCQLQEMDLADDIVCYSLPFIQSGSEKEDDTEFLQIALNTNRKEQIPKIIHGFWFSGEEKPEVYQRCFNTWSEICPDYDIKEWNLGNYDYKKHPFLKKAIDCKAWAFATDYARLDVVYNHGGFYLDMDVELLKRLDNLLGNDAVFSFSNAVYIDLAVFGAKHHDALVKSIMCLYDDIKEIPNSKEEFKKYFQPAFVRGAFHDAGVIMNGYSQMIENRAFFSHDYFMPLDYVTFDKKDIGENAISVHYDNFGWGVNETNTREKKERDNQKMREMIESYSRDGELE